MCSRCHVQHPRVLLLLPTPHISHPIKVQPPAAAGQVPALLLCSPLLPCLAIMSRIERFDSDLRVGELLGSEVRTINSN
ncbi:hypothetical protein E2C01_050062 [Portunus trituberculatus]|uniref:Uncharacterized protein n=1 Tax=Portunus trituberculatus TaxID=210409 RepID=A0A5B7GF30_PORTR|nr:hypothetical protein [Portunus trituberculatus]